MKFRLLIPIVCALFVSTVQAEDLKSTANCNEVIFQLGYTAAKTHWVTNIEELSNILTDYNRDNSRSYLNHSDRKGNVVSWKNGCRYTLEVSPEQASYGLPTADIIVFGNGTQCSIKSPEGMTELKCISSGARARRN